MAQARDAILEALENLTADELKKFKLKLLSVPLRPGFSRLPRGPLLSMDTFDLSDKLVSYYLAWYGAELTATVLSEMGMQEQAERLQEISSQGAGAAQAARALSAPLGAAANPGVHFVDQHRAALIARVTDVSGVLDALYGTVLNDEQYQEVQAEATNRLKMRKLFSYGPAWDQNCKDLLLKALEETQPYLVADLQHS